MLFCLNASSQNANLIIQVNNDLIEEGISGMYLLLGSGQKSQKIPLEYYPGELVLTQKTWSIVNSDTSTSCSLHFNYYTHSEKGEEVANFYVNFLKVHLKQRYLILNIYDFRDKKFRKWYQWHTDKDFLAELIFPNSGMFIRRK